MSDIVNYYQTIPDVNIQGRMDTTIEFEKIGFPKKMEGKSILDIGCNTGAFLIEAYKRGSRVLNGIEPNDDYRWISIGILTEQCPMAHVKRVLPDVKDITFGSFDVVLILSVLHVCENPQDILDEAWKRTKQNGLLIVEVNDRLQDEKIVLPGQPELFGKNKDNRSVFHIYKNG